MNNKLGIASCYYSQSSASNWSIAAKAGITDAEISLSLYPPDVIPVLEDCESTYNDLTTGGLKVSSVHLPFHGDWDISEQDHTKWIDTINRYKQLIKWTGDKRINIVILHPSGDYFDDNEYENRIITARQAIKELYEYAKIMNVRIALENLIPNMLGATVGELLYLTNNGEYAGICFDTNHLFFESHKEFIRKIGKHIITTHLSDYDRTGDVCRHWVIGDGCINWKELIENLSDAGYTGSYLFELNEPEPVNGINFTPQELVRRFYTHTGLKP